MSFLRKYGHSALGLTFLITVLSIQIYLLFEEVYIGVFTGSFSKINISIESLIRGEFCAATILISLGALLGKTSFTQMVFITVVEPIFYCLNERLGLYLKVADIGGSMVIHAFGIPSLSNNRMFLWISRI